MKSLKKIFYMATLINFIYVNAVAQQINTNQQTITVTGFAVYEKEARLYINWAVQNNVTCNYWKIQRSKDSVQFSTIAIVMGNDPKQEGNAYQYKEKIKDIKNIKVYYRLCHIDTNGNEQFSEILEPAK